MDEQKQTEMIIRIDQALADMNKSIDKDSKSNTKAHDEILLQIDKQRTCILNQSKSFIQSKLFYWMMGFVVLGIFTVAGIASNNSHNISKAEAKIEANIEK